jgi:cobalt-zinc-cadmium efflux system membrane fusion protein
VKRQPYSFSSLLLPDRFPSLVQDLLPALLLVLLTVAAALACKPEKPAAETAAPRLEGDRIVFAANSSELASLSTAPAQQAAARSLRTTGRLAWDEDRTSRVYAPVAGRVRRLLAQPGQKVLRGSPLAALESADYGQAQADANRARTDLAAAERNYQRQRELFEHQAAARKDLDAAEADRDRGRVESERTARRLASLGGGLGTVDQQFVLRSPVAGTVVDRVINPGLEVRTDAQTPLFVVSDPTHLWVFLDITERDMARARPGAGLVLRSNAYPERVFHGRLDLLGDTLDPATRTVKARGSLPNPDRLLKAEMYVDVEVADPAQPPALEVPSAAVVSSGKRSYVFVEEGRGRFQRRPVEPGPERAGRTLILAGLNAGQRVVVDGSLLLETLLESKS